MYLPKISPTQNRFDFASSVMKDVIDRFSRDTTKYQNEKKKIEKGKRKEK